MSYRLRPKGVKRGEPQPDHRGREGIKSKSFQDLTEAHHAVQKPALLSGISRTYQPKDEEGEQLPPESTKVQVRAEEVLRQTAATLTRLFDKAPELGARGTPWDRTIQFRKA